MILGSRMGLHQSNWISKRKIKEAGFTLQTEEGVHEESAFGFYSPIRSNR